MEISFDANIDWVDICVNVKKKKKGMAYTFVYSVFIFIMQGLHEY